MQSNNYHQYPSLTPPVVPITGNSVNTTYLPPGIPSTPMSINKHTNYTQDESTFNSDITDLG